MVVYDANTVATSLKARRICRGFRTQRDLAKSCGVSESTIYSIEAGEVSPTLKTASKIANALECTVNDLMSIPN